ncbi:MAG: DUF5666 domain-containing protein [Candidatus Angelobacter sp.]
MHRSPNTLLALVLLSVSVGWAQTSPSADPKQGSGLPQTPVTETKPGTQTTAPSMAPTTTTPSTTTPSSNSQPAAPDQQKPNAQQSAAGQSAQQLNVDEPLIAPAESAPQAQPKTDILDSSATSGALTTDGHDPILDAAPVPRTTTTLVGGTIDSVDRMRNRMTVKVFGGGHWKVNFDERTHIFRNGAEATQLALKKGERVYVDTQLDNNRHDIFARNIRVGVATPPADADGQIIAVDRKHNELTLRDTINSVPVRFAIDPETRISNGQTPAAFKDMLPGTLVHVRFAAERPNRGLAREINILAAPGANFTFAGKITYLDLHRGVLAVQNSNDDRNYEIHFSSARADRNSLGVGTEVRVVATFEGAQYTAQSINVTKENEVLEK